MLGNNNRKTIIKIKHIFISLALIIGCEPGSDVTGSENVNEIGFVQFSSIEYSAEANKLKATGIVTNTSNSAVIPSPWFVEGQFYYESESGNTFIIKGDSYRVTNTLQAGISQNWELEISVEDASGYDNFYLSDLRAYVNQ
tara:strand:- start:143 stop:565 length:423 start_codon:yes stop_codon:yes gene_type:complete